MTGWFDVPNEVPTPEVIAALLSDAGFGQATAGSGNEGFHAHAHPVAGKVIVDYWDTGRPAPQRRKARRDMLSRYASAIRAVGWHVDLGESRDDYLIVLAPEAEPGR
jgi:hypothetical protein